MTLLSGILEHSIYEIVEIGGFLTVQVILTTRLDVLDYEWIKLETGETLTDRSRVISLSMLWHKIKNRCALTLIEFYLKIEIVQQLNCKTSNNLISKNSLQYNPVILMSVKMTDLISDELLCQWFRLNRLADLL